MIILRHILPVCMLLWHGIAGAQITFQQPDSGSSWLAEGEDYASFVLGNRWNMEDASDLVMTEFKDVANRQFNQGVFEFNTTGTDSQVWLIYPGLPGAVPVQAGFHYPVDTSEYRYLSFKIRYSGSGISINQPFLMYFLDDGNSFNDGSFGWSNPVYFQPDEWTIVTIDLHTEGVGAGAGRHWLDYALIEGLRLDPTNKASVNIEIDWVRLTKAAQANQLFTVQWTGGSAPYEVSLLDESGVETAVLAQVLAQVTNPSVQLDMSHYPPGQYHVRVNGVDSPHPITVNEAPLAKLLQPDVRGAQEWSYAKINEATPWGPMDAGDIADVDNLENVNYSNPAGSMSARPTNSDSKIFMNNSQPIDAETFRMLCFEFEIKGERDVTNGSVSRVFWGDQLHEMTTSDDIVIQEGMNEYCLGDLRQLKLDPNSQFSAPWSGTKTFLRIDPHEFPQSTACNQTATAENCRDIVLQSFRLSPYDFANPGFTFSWEDSDSDSDASISIYADIDQIPGNGNDILLLDQINENDSNTANWTNSQLSDGVYQIYIKSNDGLNESFFYASGPLFIGQMPFPTSGIVFADGFES